MLASKSPGTHEIHPYAVANFGRTRRPSFGLKLRPSRVRKLIALSVTISLLFTLLSIANGYVFAQGSTARAVPAGTAVAGNYNGQYRPQIHFSPPQGFMNDPSGLFQDAQGIHHLYYQYNPNDTIAGNQHWGHATSTDLYHWINQPIALFPYDNVTGIFTGSCVIDVNNTSGFFPDQTNGVVAIYTANSPDDQNQAIAFSHDDGYTWTHYADNPVLAIGSTQFRDPKVIWHSPTSSWVMVVAYARDFSIGIFTSPNLLDWTAASNFSYAGILGLQYECPNLVLIPFHSSCGSPQPPTPVWLMYISINPGAPLGGSIGQYFTGTFNGTHFDPFDSAARLADFGKDNYASQFFYFDHQDGSADAISIAWASNWQYTNYVPTGPAEGWQSAMSLPRRNYITNSSASHLDYTLVSLPYDLRPVTGRLLARNTSLGNGTLTASSSPTSSNNKTKPATGSFLITANVTSLNTSALHPGTSFNITLSSSATGESLHASQLFADDPTFFLTRRHTTGLNHNPFFTDSVSTALAPAPTWDLLMVLDRSVCEVFLAGGQRSTTQTFFLADGGVIDEVVLRAGGMPSGTQVSVEVRELESVWT